MYHHSRIPTLIGGSGGGSLLPPELQACEYLQSDNHCHIVLNNKINTIEELGGSFSQNVVLGNNSGIFGGGTTHQTLQCSVNLNIKYFFRCWNAVSSDQTTITINANVENIDFYINRSSKEIRINGNTYHFTHNILDINYNLYIFGSYFEDYSPSLYENQNNLKIKNLYSNVFNLYSCYIKTSKTYIDQHSITCPAGTPGMYDTMNQIFYTNDGTGNFTCGPDINI